MRNSFKNLTFSELKAKRDELSRKYMDFRFQLVIGHVDNPLQKRTLRRQIARLNTLIREHELTEQRQARQEAVAAQMRAQTQKV
jgi:large subunit ribosomal protein L29